MGARNRGSRPYTTKIPEEAPQHLTDHIFFGLELDEEQKQYRDAIWNPEVEIVFCNAKAGPGKTLIAVATSVLLYQYGLYDEIMYVMHPVGEAQGYLPGTITEKSSVYFEALYQSLEKAKQEPYRVMKNTSISASEKMGEGYVTAITDTYLRGSNIGGGAYPTVLIIDEAQNFTEDSLRKVLTRVCRGTKVICIGHDLQCDIADGPGAFLRCMNHFAQKKDPRFAFCKLSVNHRSLIAQTADEKWEELEEEKKKRVQAKGAKG